MLVTYGGLSVELSGKVTHERFQDVIRLAALTDQLRDLQHCIITSATKGDGAELARLQQKQRRLQTRIQDQRAKLKL